MTISEQKFLIKGRAGRELALAVQDNTSVDAEKLRGFFKVKREQRAKVGLLSELDKQSTVSVLSTMVGNAPFELPTESRNRPEKILVGTYCVGSTPYYYFINQSTGQYESAKVTTGEYENLCTEF